VLTNDLNVCVFMLTLQKLLGQNTTVPSYSAPFGCEVTFLDVLVQKENLHFKP